MPVAATAVRKNYLTDMLVDQLEEGPDQQSTSEHILKAQQDLLLMAQSRVEG